MAYVTYTAKRSVIAGHTAGTSYSIEFKCAAIDKAPKSNKQVVDALDGSRDTVLHSITKFIDVQVGAPYVAHANYGLWEEFLDSVMGGETFTFDAYGTLATPDNPISVEIDGDYAIPRRGKLMQYMPAFKVKVL